jgi:DNA-binding NtrC family response regulator
VGSIASPGAKTLKGLSVLVVEDDFLVLSELEAVLREAGADAIHCCRTIRQATAMLDQKKTMAAILDVRIGGDSITPVARTLVQRGTPFLFYTGQINGDRIMAEWPDRPVLSKPSSSQRIVSAVVDLMRRAPVLPRRSA